MTENRPVHIHHIHFIRGWLTSRYSDDIRLPFGKSQLKIEIADLLLQWNLYYFFPFLLSGFRCVEVIWQPASIKGWKWNRKRTLVRPSPPRLKNVIKMKWDGFRSPKKSKLKAKLKIDCKSGGKWYEFSGRTHRDPPGESCGRRNIFLEFMEDYMNLDRLSRTDEELELDTSRQVKNDIYVCMYAYNCSNFLFLDRGILGLLKARKRQSN